MNGLELSRRYFQEYGINLISEYPEYSQYMAAGLVGEGSECYGFDDMVSRDHDFGPGFSVWMPQTVYDIIGQDMADKYRQLPLNFEGVRRVETVEGGGRVGIFSIEDFYGKYTGCKGLPENSRQWYMIPERYLSIATNGQVFMDNLGEFSRIRQGLKDFYPRDVLLKKLAARTAIMAQAGQYNYGRSVMRGDFPSAYLACSRFIETALSTIFLLNGEYMPFYKWSFRAAEGLSLLRSCVIDLKKLAALADNEENSREKKALIESICVAVASQLNSCGYSTSKDPFLQTHCEQIMWGISDNWLRSLHVMADTN